MLFHSSLLLPSPSPPDLGLPLLSRFAFMRHVHPGPIRTLEEPIPCCDTLAGTMGTRGMRQRGHFQPIPFLGDPPQYPFLSCLKMDTPPSVLETAIPSDGNEDTALFEGPELATKLALSPLLVSPSIFLLALPHSMSNIPCQLQPGLGSRILIHDLLHRLLLLVSPPPK